MGEKSAPRWWGHPAKEDVSLLWESGHYKITRE